MVSSLLAVRALPIMDLPWLPFDRGMGLPEFVRIPGRLVRRCDCGLFDVAPTGCMGRCPEPLSQESTGLCGPCGGGYHLQKGSVVRAEDVARLQLARLAPAGEASSAPVAPPPIAVPGSTPRERRMPAADGARAREMTFNLPPLPVGARVVLRDGRRGAFQRAEGATALVRPEGCKRSVHVLLEDVWVEGREPFRCSASVRLDDGALGACGQLGTAYRSAAQLPPRLLSRTWYACPKDHAWRVDQYAHGHRRYPVAGGVRSG